MQSARSELLAEKIEVKKGFPPDFFETSQVENGVFFFHFPFL